MRLVGESGQQVHTVWFTTGRTDTSKLRICSLVLYSPIAWAGTLEREVRGTDKPICSTKFPGKWVFVLNNLSRNCFCPPVIQVHDTLRIRVRSFGNLVVL